MPDLGWHLCPASRDHGPGPRQAITDTVSLPVASPSLSRQPLSPARASLFKKTVLNSILHSQSPCTVTFVTEYLELAQIPNSFHCPEQLRQRYLLSPPSWTPLDLRLPQMELFTCYTQMPQPRIHPRLDCALSRVQNDAARTDWAVKRCFNVPMLL